MTQEEKPSIPDGPPPRGIMEITRRYFLELVGATALGAAALGSIAVILDYLHPRSLLEPPRRFRAGVIQDYPPGSVVFRPRHSVYIVRRSSGAFHCMSAVCTHLGCITNWRPELGLIACPCHGSKFDLEGNVLAGPAPRPLPHYSLELDEERQLVVDTAKPIDPQQILKV